MPKTDIRKQSSRSLSNLAQIFKKHASGSSCNSDDSNVCRRCSPCVTSGQEFSENIRPCHASGLRHHLRSGLPRLRRALQGFGFKEPPLPRRFPSYSALRPTVQKKPQSFPHPRSRRHSRTTWRSLSAWAGSKQGAWRKPRIWTPRFCFSMGMWEGMRLLP